MNCRTIGCRRRQKTAGVQGAPKSLIGSIMRNVETPYPRPEIVEGQLKPQGIPSWRDWGCGRKMQEEANAAPETQPYGAETLDC